MVLRRDEMRTYTRNLLASTVHVLTPQILRVPYASGPLQKKNASPTAWLNGVRGIAAIIVVNWHFLRLFTDRVQLGFGSSPDHHNILELFFLRALWNASMVHVFFMVGGYAIALRPLQLMREASVYRSSPAQDPVAPGADPLLKNLSSSAFRRGFRLFLPCMVVMGVVAILSRLGLYDLLKPYIEVKEPWLHGGPDPIVARQPSLAAQLFLWYTEVVGLMNVWQLGNFFPKHDAHLWTMRYEMRASLCLYGIFLATAQCKQLVRLSIMLTVTVWSSMMGRWAEGLFMLGACLAQINVARGQHDSSAPNALPVAEKSDAVLEKTFVQSDETHHRFPSQWAFLTEEKQSPRVRTIKALATEGAWHFLFFGSIYMLSAPHARWTEAPGFVAISQALYTIMGEYSTTWRWNLAAFVFVAALSVRSPNSVYRRIFSHPCALYLGKLSFAIYILHGPVLHSGGFMVPIWIWMLMGYSGQPELGMSWAFGLGLGWLVCMAIIVCGADVFHREVESRLVRLTAWIEGRCFEV